MYKFVGLETDNGGRKDWLFIRKLTQTITNQGLISNAITPGQEVDFSIVVPDMLQIDLIKSIITSFNLFTIVDIANKNISYETYEMYYENGKSLDWTTKLNTSQPIEYLLGNEYTSNKIILTHQEGSSFWSKKYSDRYKDQVFGNKIINTGNEFETNEYKVETKFAVNLFDMPIDGMYITRMNESDPKDSKIDLKLSDPPIIGFFNTTPINSHWNFYYDDVVNSKDEAPSFTAWFDPTMFNIGYGSKTTDLLLNFNTQPTIDKSGQIGKPLHNLYSEYWRNYLLNLLDKNARILKAYFDLSINDYSELKMNETINIDGTSFFINKVSDFQDGKLTECELIKTIFNNKVYVEGEFPATDLNDDYTVIVDPVIPVDPIAPTTTSTGLIDGGLDLVFGTLSVGLIEGGENNVGPTNPIATGIIDGGKDTL